MKVVKNYMVSNALIGEPEFTAISDDIIKRIKEEKVEYPVLYLRIKPFEIKSIYIHNIYNSLLNFYHFKVTESTDSKDIMNWIYECVYYQMTSIAFLSIELVDDAEFKPEPLQVVDPKLLTKSLFNNDITYIKKDDFSKDAIDMDNDELTQYVHQTACDHSATVDKTASEVDEFINDLNLWKGKLDSFHELPDHQKVNIMTSIVDSIYNALDALANLASDYDERFIDYNQRLSKKFSVLDAYVDGISERLDDHLDDEEDDTE